jgi:hypothetical protein
MSVSKATSGSGERIATAVRFRAGLRRAVDEAAVLLGGLSREQALHLLLNEGLAAAYARLGIEKDPAATAAELLGAIAGTWESDLSDDEIAAIETTRKAMERIAQIRAREPKTGD